MLLPREQSPWNCGYFLGAIALEALKGSPKGGYDLIELQQRMSRRLNRTISPTQVVSAAAWLFLIDMIKLETDGTIVTCS
jgi:hypothetical protein